MTTSQKPIPVAFSIYLDLLRFTAAIFVFLFHIRKLAGPAEITKLIPDHGHDAVILFFVLSGYVIAAATDRKLGAGLREYVLDRAARVYSVALPTLVLCAFFALFLQPVLDPQNHYSVGQLVVDSGLNLLFLGQSWSLKSWVYFNQPYWSLCYEVMYYLGFGLFMFLRGWRRWLGVGMACLIAGPKVLLLLPCWIVGVLAYRLRDRIQLSQGVAFVFAFILPPLCLFALHRIGFGEAARSFFLNLMGDQKSYLEFSNEFFIDYVTALLVAINLYAARYVQWTFPAWVKTVAIEGAAVSFTLYLMHLPLIFLIINLSGALRNSLFIFLVILVVVPLVCYVVAGFTEKKRPLLRGWLDKVLPAR